MNVTPVPLGHIPTLQATRRGASTWCVKHGDEVLSWGELSRRANRRAHALTARGVGRNDLVILSLPNSAALYELTFAIWKLGAVPSVVSWRLPLQEFRAILEVARPKAVIVSDPAIAAAVDALPVDFGLAEGRDDELDSVVGDHWKAMTSGGSTGRPKVIVDHAPGEVDLDTEVMLMPRDGTILNPGPCYHNAPFTMTHNALFRGSAVVGMAKFDPEEALRLIDENRIGWVNFVPTMMNRIWRLPQEVRRRYDISCLQAVWHMAAPMPAWLKEHWIDWLGPEKIWEMYGGTERQGLTIINGVEWLQHRGSVGLPVACDIRILDENGQELTHGEVGEIFLRPHSGAGSTYHYLGATPKAVGDGFETIGDFGSVDADGYLYLADRRTDLILSGGANIYPAEVEGALLEHPGVEAAVVIGLPDEDMGAVTHAIVRRDPASDPVTPEALLAFLSERLVRYKLPRSIEFTEEVLRDDAGKVRRGQLREARIARGRMEAV
ncbi:MAG: AMP-binding protein [Caulobacterales bacterium]|nr:AMP-binding protein [Caulobacterales bacterium]